MIHVLKFVFKETLQMMAKWKMLGDLSIIPFIQSMNPSLRTEKKKIATCTTTK
jgi:hypothetical protein